MLGSTSSPSRGIFSYRHDRTRPGDHVALGHRSTLECYFVEYDVRGVRMASFPPHNITLTHPSTPSRGIRHVRGRPGIVPDPVLSCLADTHPLRDTTNRLGHLTARAGTQPGGGIPSAPAAALSLADTATIRWNDTSHSCALRITMPLGQRRRGVSNTSFTSPVHHAYGHLPRLKLKWNTTHAYEVE